MCHNGLTMIRKFSLIQWLAILYAVQFFVVVSVGHIPGFIDAEGNLFGFYHVSFLIDASHFISGVAALVAALHSTRWSTYYFRLVAIPYGIDCIVSFLFSRDLTETGSILTQGIGPSDWSFHNGIANSPHIVLVGVALWIGYSLAPRIGVKTPRQLLRRR